MTSAATQTTAVFKRRRYTGSKASSDTSAETSPEDTVLGKTESETEALQKEAENTENNTSQEAESTYSTEINCGINDSSIISVYIHGSGQTLQMTLHDYITGVVASEMPVYFGTEAIRAQAIAARTYAIYKIIGGQDSGEHPGIYLCDATSHCCAYTPKSSSYDKWGESGNSVIQTAEAAVYDTENKVVTYNESCICSSMAFELGESNKKCKGVWGEPCSLSLFSTNLRKRQTRFRTRRGNESIRRRRYGRTRIQLRRNTSALLYRLYNIPVKINNSVIFGG